MTSPSAETLRRILLLEQSQGYQDRAVIGGIGRFLATWQAQADDEPGVDVSFSVDQVLSLMEGYAAKGPESRQAAVDRVLLLLSQPPAPSARSAPVDDGARPPQRSPRTASSVQPESRHRHGQQKMRTAARSATATPLITDPVTRLKGVGPAIAGRLAVLGIETIGDLAYHFPRRYDDFSQVKRISDLEFGELVTVVGVVRSISTRRSGGRVISSVILADDSGAIECTWFNQRYLDRSLRKGQEIAISGEVGEFRGRLVFSAPEWEPHRPGSLNTGRVVPVYPLTEGLYARALRRLIHDALQIVIPQLTDPLPPETRASHDLLDLPTALKHIHFPESAVQAQAARDRLCFEELLLLQLGVLHKRSEWRAEPGMAIEIPPQVLEAFTAGLPFALTGAQRRAIDEILIDMARPVPMSRLLQGDVGSGKTVVAVAAMLAVVAGGFQAALMAPTSILAEQHTQTITQMLSHLPDVTVALLEGSQSAQEKADIRARLASGEIDIIIGTHALIQEGVEFHNLGLVIVDEQHRFGVAQRQTLRDKNTSFRPHMLAMSATPIPRTLALTIYGDMDVSVLDELPPHRQPILTAVRTQSSREAVYRFVRDEVEAGHQAYVIYPLVEESEQIDARAAVAEHERLSKRVFPQFRLGLLHGRVPADEKELVMRQFKAGLFDILVSTAVVEVGVDVPNATVMMIEGAERFGLAQLHQFRGRVGRGEARSYCVLLSESATEENLARLQIMAETNDGFVLAEKDLELRGPGDFMGVRQHGLPELRLAQLSDRSTLELARQEAIRIYRQDPDLSQPEHAELARHIASFWDTVSRS